MSVADATLVLVIVIISVLTGCDVTIDIQGAQAYDYAVSGFVDGEQGVYLHVTETFATDSSTTSEDAIAARVTGAEVSIFFEIDSSVVTIPMESPGIYRREDPFQVSGPIRIMVHVGGQVLQCIDSIPPALALSYDSLTTREVQTDVVGTPIEGPYVIHEAKFRTSDPRLSACVRPVSLGDQNIEFPIATRSAPECITWSDFGLLALTASCYDGEAYRLVVGGQPSSSRNLQFVIAQAYSPDFPTYLQALEQFNSSDGFGGIYELIPAPSNVDGGGGFVYVSNSRTFEVIVP